MRVKIWQCSQYQLEVLHCEGSALLTELMELKSIYLSIRLTSFRFVERKFGNLGDLSEKKAKR